MSRAPAKRIAAASVCGSLLVNCIEPAFSASSHFKFDISPAKFAVNIVSDAPVSREKLIAPAIGISGIEMDAAPNNLTVPERALDFDGNLEPLLPIALPTPELAPVQPAGSPLENSSSAEDPMRDLQTLVRPSSRRPSGSESAANPALDAYFSQAQPQTPIALAPMQGDQDRLRISGPLIGAALLLPGSSAFHEAGHYLALRAAGRPAEMRANNVIHFDLDSLSHWKKIMVHAAGPTFSLLLSAMSAVAAIHSIAGPSWNWLFWAYASLNFYLGVTNLIPMEPKVVPWLTGEIGASDGRNILDAWRKWRESNMGMGRVLTLEKLTKTDLRPRVPAQDYSDIDERLSRIIGPPDDVAEIARQTQAVIALEERFGKMTISELQNTTARLRRRLKFGAKLDDVLPEAFAAAREAMARVLGKRPYIEQIAAGVGLHLGLALEQKTGEGKTLSIGLAAYLNALAGPVDIFTFNPYLAIRDADEIGRAMAVLGIGVGGMTGRNWSYLFSGRSGFERDDFRGNMIRVSRADVYRKADILYGDNRAFVFDYLFDQDANSAQHWVTKKRPKRCAIFDEVDAALGEEANNDFRIVSLVNYDESPDYRYLYDVVAEWKAGEDFVIDPRSREVHLTDKSRRFINVLQPVLGLKHPEILLANALKARHVLALDKDYVVMGGRIVILDHPTGRLLWGHHWEDGLHRFVEIKEGLKTEQDYRLASHIGFNNFVRLYKRISGITGTIRGAEDEFARVYRLRTVYIPPHRPSVRQDLPDRFFFTETGKLHAVVEEAASRRAAGQPILVGTKDLAESVRVVEIAREKRQGLQLLNGMQKESEQNIVDRAGSVGALTVGTQLTGRGTDISPAAQALANGGFHVLLTGKGSSLRVDIQYRGRAGRQGRPGSSQQFISLEDELIRRFATAEEIERLRSWLEQNGDGAEVDAEIAELLGGIQARAESFDASRREGLRRKDKLLEPVRRTYFAWREGFFHRLNPFSRRTTLDDIHRLWTGFIADYEDLWRRKADSITAEEVKELYRRTVVQPHRIRLLTRPLRTCSHIFKAFLRFFEDTFYGASIAWLYRRLILPFAGRVCMCLGWIVLKMKIYFAAEALMTPAIMGLPKMPRAYATRGDARFNRGNYKGAINDYVRSLMLWDGGAIRFFARRIGLAFHDLAVRQQSDGNPLAAAAYFRMSEDLLHPTVPQQQLSEELQSQLAPEDAAFIRTALPNLKYVYLNEARERMDQEYYETAIHLFSRALEIDPHLVEAYLGRGLAFGLTGRRSEAGRDLHKGIGMQVLESEPFELVRLSYSKLHSKSLDASMVEKALSVFNKDYPNKQISHWEVSREAARYANEWWRQGNELYSAGHYYAAASYYDHALAHDPYLSPVYLKRAKALFHLGDFRGSLENAIESIKRGLIGPDGRTFINAGLKLQFPWRPNAAAMDAFFDRLKRL